VLLSIQVRPSLSTNEQPLPSASPTLVAAPPHGSPRRVPLQGRSQGTVQRILDAASRLLEKVSLDDLTTSRIAAESDVSIGGLYRFFPDKQAILDAIAVARQKEFEEHIAASFLEDLPRDGRVFFGRMIDAYVDFLDQHPDFRTLVFHRQISPETRRRESQPNTGAAALLKQFMVHYLGMADTTELSLKLRVAIEAGERLLVFAYEQPTTEERVLAVEQLKLLLAGYLFPSPGA
jgi:AcrR family transcriptional regulator